MDEKFVKKVLDMVSNMKEDELRKNLEKVSQVMGNTNADELMKKLKDNNIRK